jgi:UDP-3-O-[3-hydroxymyristoyl] glucosamine N-acyltransferase
MSERKVIPPVSVRDLMSRFPEDISVVQGDQDAYFETFCPVNNPCASAVTWAVGRALTELSSDIDSNLATVYITEESVADEPKTGKCVIVAKKAKLLYVKVLTTYFAKRVEPGIHPTASIASGAVIGDGVHIGPFCHIGNATIGDGCVLEGNVHVYDNVTLGKRVVVQAGAVIGSKGMSLVSDHDGALVGFPALGEVIIGNDVEIGSNCCIDMAVIGVTRIGEGTTVNSMTFLGNAVTIGCRNFIAAGVKVNGSVNIGDLNFIGTGAVIINKRQIGSNNTIGAGSVVVKDVGDHQTVYGNPAAVKHAHSRISL